MLHEEESFMPTEQQEKIFSEPLQVAFAQEPHIKSVLKFQRRLILRVRKHRQLYDAKHELFKDIESKEKIWFKIATNLNVDVQKCKNTWADLRYQYQRYVRRLRKYLLYKNTQRKKRPVMALESDLLFLWRFIPQKSYAPNPCKELNSKNKETIQEDEDDDVVMLEDEDPVVIILDDEDRITTKPSPIYKLTPEMRKLVNLIKDYPELFDHNDKFFNDYRRKGIIWAGIANESNDKATKLMKMWIQLQTRFEWESIKNKSPITDFENDIRYVMRFLLPYILKNPNTVYKQSSYLKSLWHDPIEHFKNIYNLVATLKRYPKVVRETEKELTAQMKSSTYMIYWSDIARYRGKCEASAGQYEITWLILRFFYWELMNMRRSSYQLQDKWYFESIITDLYESVKLKTVTPIVNPSNTNTIQRIPTLSKFNLPVTNSITSSVSTTVSSTLSSTVTSTVNTPMNDSVSHNRSLSNLGTQNFILPKIVSAKSLAPVSTPSQTVSKGLQITPIMPANAMTVVPTNGFSYNRQQVNNVYQPVTQRQIAMPKTTNQPISMPKPTNQPISMPKPTNQPISMPKPTNQPISMPKPTNQPISMPKPTNQPISMTKPTNQPISMPKPTNKLVSTTVQRIFSGPQTQVPLPTPSKQVPIPTPPKQVPFQTLTSTPSQFSGSHPSPKITNAHITKQRNDFSNIVDATIRSAITNNGNLVNNKKPVLKTQDPTSAPYMSHLTSDSNPKTMPITTLPQIPNVTKASHLPQFIPVITNTPPPSAQPVVSSPPPLHPLAAPMINIRPNLETKPQSNPMDLSNVEIPASVVPNPAYSCKKTKTGNADSTVSLNGNEILIELIAAAHGNQLVVHGPPLEDNFTMTMEETALFIREAMALPLLHNKTCTKGSRVQAYWVFLASKFNMPAHVCRAVWNFLSENFIHFSKIAPMEELMKPFKTEAKPWRTGTSLFNRFIENFIRKGWIKYEHQLPIALEKIGHQRCLYHDLNRGSKIQLNSKKIAEIWNKIREELKIEDIEEIWRAFKGAFWQYMHDLETGLVNHWPQRLWRCFSKLDFLIRHRYNTLEPFYYIVRNKFNEEVQICAELERNGSTPMSTFSMKKINSPQSYELDGFNLLAAVKRNSNIYLPSTIAQKETAWINVANELNSNVSACRLAFQRAVKNYRIYMARDPANRCRLNYRYYKNMHMIFRAAKTVPKISIKTPNEVNQSVNDAPDPNDIIFPERMVFDINMDNSSPSLVVKNWAYGIGNCTPVVQNLIPERIHALMEKYKKFSIDPMYFKGT